MELGGWSKSGLYLPFAAGLNKIFTAMLKNVRIYSCISELTSPEDLFLMVNLLVFPTIST